MNFKLKMFRYYLKLLQKKTINKFHNKIEIKVGINACGSIECFLFQLTKILFRNLFYEKDYLYFKTKIKNNSKPLILTQARILLILTYQFFYEKNYIKKWMIRKFVNYLLSERNENGYYTFNYESWDRQDEGIATVWVLSALLKANEILQDDKLVNFITETTNIMLDKLYFEETSLVHTKGDRHWCLNAASTLAWFLSELLKYDDNQRYEKAMNNSVKICLEQQTAEGFFPYSEKRKGTYLLLYNPIVVYTLDKCKDSKYLDDSIKNSLEDKLNFARNFILKQMDNKNYFVEPEIKTYSRYIISNVTSLVALKGFIDKDLENKILLNIQSFMKADQLFMCIDDKYFLYNSSLFRLKDQLSIEVLYWLETFKGIE